MWKLEKTNSRTYACYNFSLDELYYLLDCIPDQSDVFRDELLQGIKLLEAEGEQKWKVT